MRISDLQAHNMGSSEQISAGSGDVLSPGSYSIVPT